jgi:DNA-binding Xre family transcriptional regulator
MGLRLRLPELLAEHGVTAYMLAQRSKGRISPSTLYRLVRSRGRVRYLDADLLEALCDVLDVTAGDLLERQSKSRRARDPDRITT